MEKLFYEEPYRREFTARVTACVSGKKGFEVELDRTCFYPEGGGQPADTGVLGTARVLDVHEKDGTVIHYTDRELSVGEEVTGRIDWEARFSNMQQHSGEHIVSGLIHSVYGYDNVGFHMGREEMTIDLNGPMSWEELMEIEEKANRAVWANIPLKITYPSEEELEKLDYRSKKELSGQVRIVEVPGVDTCACCGTHVSYTGEIGVIKFLSLMNYKGGVRISMLCGQKALKACDRKTEQVSAVSVLLSAKPEEIVEAVKRQRDELSEEKAKTVALTRQLMELKTASYPESDGILLVFEKDYTPVEVRQFCNLLMEAKRGQVTAVFGGQSGSFSYTLASPVHDMRTLGRELNQSLNGRGGGSERMVQGSVSASGEEVRNWFAALRERGI